MARKTLIRQNIYPYHVTIRSNNKEWFDLPSEDMWKLCLSSLTIANFKVPVKVEAFVLMNNHYHLLLFTPNANLDKFMKILNSTISGFIRRKTGRINHIFGGRYKWSLIDNLSYYQNVTRYIFQNPIRANLCKRCEEYKLSTIYYQVNKQQLPFSLPAKFTDQKFINYINERQNVFEDRKYKIALQSLGPLKT